MLIFEEISSNCRTRTKWSLHIAYRYKEFDLLGLASRMYIGETMECEGKMWGRPTMQGPVLCSAPGPHVLQPVPIKGSFSCFEFYYYQSFKMSDNYAFIGQ